uniref:Uncharacterized protein n=1 Tax=Fervidobacterium pennivorans TaxID=93466 RepID=A0A7V4KE46_FERPE
MRLMITAGTVGGIGLRKDAPYRDVQWMEKVNPGVAAFLNALASKVLHNEDLLGAVLTGSTSRKEETYILVNGEKRLLSDIEVFFVVRKRENIDAYRREISRTILMLFENYLEQFFTNFSKVDFSVYSLSQIRHMDRRFIHFETKACGVQFLGAMDILHEMPEITLSNLNWAELLTVPIHRFFSVISSFESESELFRRYALCRNMLDLVTVILPYEGYLVPTYRKRLEVFSKIYLRTSLTKFFPTTDLLDTLEYCYKFKLNPDVEEEKISYRDLLSFFLESFVNLKRYLEERNKGNSFLIDKRGIMRSLIRLSVSNLSMELRKPLLLEKLYEKMKYIIELQIVCPDQCLPGDLLGEVKSSYKQLFG